MRNFIFAESICCVIYLEKRLKSEFGAQNSLLAILELLTKRLYF
jgi:hypothetical protein